MGTSSAAGFSIEMKEEVLDKFHQDIQVSATHEEPIVPTKLYFSRQCPNEFRQYLYPEIFIRTFWTKFGATDFLISTATDRKHETFGINNSHLRLYLPTNECFIYLMETVIIKLLRATLSIFLYTNLGKIKRVYHSRDS